MKRFLKFIQLSCLIFLRHGLSIKEKREIFYSWLLQFQGKYKELATWWYNKLNKIHHFHGREYNVVWALLFNLFTLKDKKWENLLNKFLVFRNEWAKNHPDTDLSLFLDNHFNNEEDKVYFQFILDSLSEQPFFKGTNSLIKHTTRVLH